MKILKNNFHILKRAGHVLAFLVLGLFMSACDFTPRIHKDILIAQNYITNQEYALAVKQYHKILEMAPNDEIKIKVNYQIAELYSVSLGQYYKGIAFYEKIPKLTTDPVWLVKTQERIGEIAFLYINDYEKAADVYSKLSDFRPKLSNHDLYEYRLAISYIKLKKYDMATKHLVTMHNNGNHKYFVDSFYQSGVLYFDKQEWNRAIQYFREYIKREDRRDLKVRAIFLMANCYETIERLQTAYDLYYSILGEYPNNKVIQERLNSVYERRVARKR
ncbi:MULTISPECIES: tetratricopeptide repeat protein [unclassified Halobacteriovorax]|uniref:tetratricopeptide repeat protein n=1 Tax=unclassified Halobacteriovorax TaxID=2639665 RepID=UPI000EA1D486|nr:tetratricopeptide repeat protein [Halobacteriovorax sp. BALOs_7]